MATVTLVAPAGFTGKVDDGPAFQYSCDPNGIVVVDGSAVAGLLRQGFRYYRLDSGWCYIMAPVAADLVSIVAAALPVSATPMTIAAQPDYPRKLQVRVVQSGAVAGLVVNIVGTDARGNAVTESVNVAGASTATFITVNTYARVTSVTPVGTVTNVTTIGVGVGAALGLPAPAAGFNFSVYKEAVSATINSAPVDEAIGTVDAAAGSVVPTTAPNAAHSYKFWWACGIAD